MDRLRHYLVRLIIVGVWALLPQCSVIQSDRPIYCSDLAIPSGARVMVVGDLQRTGPVETWRERNDRQRALLMHQMAADQPSAVVLLGDMVWWGSSDTEWSYFDKVMRPVRDREVPILPILGNHEYYGSTADAMRHVRSRFPLMCEDWYVQRIDSVAWVMLNTNFPDIGTDVAKRQWRWYRDLLVQLDKDSSVRAVVVCGHHPPYTNSTVVGSDLVLLRHFVPLFMAASKTTLWLSGHAHTYERFDHGDKQFIVSGGGGGPRQEVLPEPARRYVDAYDGAPLRPFHYLVVERSGNTLTCTMRALRDPKPGVKVPATDMVVLPLGGRPHVADGDQP